MTTLYFVYTGASKLETEVIQDIQPPRLLISYYYFRNKNLQAVVQQLGYTPEILLDSGAYSAWTKGKNIALVDYMNYINNNREWISGYISLDVIGDSRLSRWYYMIMREYGFDPIPVFHWGEDDKHLAWYIEEGATRIALGGTVPVHPKEKVAEWVKTITAKYPNISFHLLGSSSEKVIDCGIASCDSSTWIMMAANGKPKFIKGSKKELAKYNMIQLMERFQEAI